MVNLQQQSVHDKLLRPVILSAAKHLKSNIIPARGIVASLTAMTCAQTTHKDTMKHQKQMADAQPMVNC